MSKHKDRPVPRDGRTVWTYWVSRDSICGALSGKAQLWCRKPIRCKHGYRVTWVNADETDPGHIGEYSLDHVRYWFGTMPDTDLELIRAEQYAPETSTPGTPKQ